MDNQRRLSGTQTEHFPIIHKPRSGHKIAVGFSLPLVVIAFNLTFIIKLLVVNKRINVFVFSKVLISVETHNCVGEVTNVELDFELLRSA
eukprot:10022251-Heterocapsa_arctica.AAC.1